MNTLIIEYLSENNVPHKELKHEPVGNPVLYSEKIGSRLEQQAKALMLRCKTRKEKYFIVVAMPANKRLSFNSIKSKIRGLKSIRLAEISDMKRITNCKPGELPPIGKLWGLPLYVDRELLKEDEIYFNAGRLDLSVIMDPKTLVRFEEGSLIEI